MVTRRPFLDLIPTTANVANQLAYAGGGADIAAFIGFEDESQTWGRFSYGDGEVVARLAGGSYGEGDLCPVTLDGAGRVEQAVAPLVEVAEDRAPVGQLGAVWATAGDASQLAQESAEAVASAQESIDAVSADLLATQSAVEAQALVVAEIPAVRQKAEDALSKAVDAQGAAEGAAQSAEYAITAANLAQQAADGVIFTGPDAPDAEKYQVWLKTNDEGRVTSVSTSNGATWSLHATLTGMLIVPGEDGSTIVDGDGVNTAKLVAEIISAQQAAFKMISGEAIDVSKPVPREALEGGVKDSLAAADAWGERTKIEPGRVTIAQASTAAEGLTAMILEPTKLILSVAGAPTVVIDSQREQLQVKNVVVSGQSKLGQHLVSSTPDGVTNWVWVGA